MKMDPILRSQPSVAKDGIAVYTAVGNISLPHRHQWLELAYLKQGTLLHTIGDVSYKLQAGEFFIVEYDQIHSYVSMGEGEIRLGNIMFHPAFIDPMLNDACHLKDTYDHYLISFNETRIDKIPTLTKFSDPSGRIRSFVDEIFEEVSQKNVGWKETTRCLLIYIIIHALREICSADKPDAGIRFSLPIINYVQKHYMQPIRICDAYGSKQYTNSYLSKHFKQEMGVTFSEFVKHVRINASCRLLANTAIPISDVAERVGYKDTTFFHKTFRAIIGCSPLEFRRRKAKQPPCAVGLPEEICAASREDSPL